MTAHAVFDVEIQDAERYKDYLRQVKAAPEAAGARYLVRGSVHRVYEGE